MSEHICTYKLRKPLQDGVDTDELGPNWACLTPLDNDQHVDVRRAEGCVDVQ